MATLKFKRREFSGYIKGVFFLSMLFFFGMFSSSAASYQAVVLNELNWAGSADGNGGGSTSDEWIELRNTTNAAIDISGWQISEYDDAQDGTGEHVMLEIPAGKIIPAQGFFLITNNPESDSRYRPTVSPDFQTSDVNLPTRIRIRLYDGNFDDAIEEANLIDSAGDGTKAALFEGESNKTTGYRTMSRKFIPGDGTHKNDWFRSRLSKNLEIPTHNFGSPANSSVTEISEGFPEVVYEDGEDKDSSDWVVYDTNPSGTKIKNQTSGGLDDSRDVKISGAVMQARYSSSHSREDASVLNGGGVALRKINNPLHKNFLFSIKTENDNFIIYAKVITNDGYRFLEYTSGDEDKLSNESSAYSWIPNNIYVHHSLGSNISDGQWYSFSRNLQLDLNDQGGGNENLIIEYVEGIYIRISGEVDNIVLRSE